ncbi:hypothetical protein DPMN_182159 [Dreissena polymorpha]|uniref:Uncharacterized protein n=1 Tax=Dreissena polymorpha TaxID=45954 RepID=A0A9D4I4C3_DREPO|nr:hypothetical protein DPMN_182159 [Dreissena polymorpha]
MSLLIYLGSVILLTNGGQGDLTWDNVYGMLPAKLDNLIFEQVIVKKEVKDLMTSTRSAGDLLGKEAQ